MTANNLQEEGIFCSFCLVGNEVKKCACSDDYYGMNK
jgi:hypothetical protein